MEELYENRVELGYLRRRILTSGVGRSKIR